MEVEQRLLWTGAEETLWELAVLTGLVNDPPLLSLMAAICVRGARDSPADSPLIREFHPCQRSYPPVLR